AAGTEDRLPRGSGVLHWRHRRGKGETARQLAEEQHLQPVPDLGRGRTVVKILVTGAAGFIGYHVSRRLLERGDDVVGIDNLNDYYDPSLKEARLVMLREFPRFTFERLDIADREAMERCFAAHRPARVINLAAQAGVRYSLTNPHAYTES